MTAVWGAELIQAVLLTQNQVPFPEVVDLWGMLKGGLEKSKGGSQRTETALRDLLSSKQKPLGSPPLYQERRALSLHKVLSQCLLLDSLCTFYPAHLGPNNLSVYLPKSFCLGQSHQHHHHLGGRTTLDLTSSIERDTSSVCIIKFLLWQQLRKVYTKLLGGGEALTEHVTQLLCALVMWPLRPRN